MKFERDSLCQIEQPWLFRVGENQGKTPCKVHGPSRDRRRDSNHCQRIGGSVFPLPAPTPAPSLFVSVAIVLFGPLWTKTPPVRTSKQFAHPSARQVWPSRCLESSAR